MSKRRYMKKCNGTGSVTKLKGKRRKPWVARAATYYIYVDCETGETVDKLPSMTPAELAQKYKLKEVRPTIGYFATRDEADEARIAYNKNPYDLAASEATFEEVCDKWLEVYKRTHAQSTVKDYSVVLKRLSPEFCRMKIANIRTSTMEELIIGMKVPLSTATRLTGLLSGIFDFAVKRDYCDKNYADILNPAALAMKETVKNAHVPLTLEEIEAVMSTDSEVARIVKVALYTGMRIGELLTLEADMINLSEGYIKHGIKTEAGKGRIIPIHTVIFPLLQRLTRENEEGCVFNGFACNGKSRSKYGAYNFALKNMLPGHSFHDMRHTFITQWRSVLNLDDKIGHAIFGHKSTDISEAVYTHRTLESLKAEMDKFHYGSKDVSIFRVS